MYPSTTFYTILVFILYMAKSLPLGAQITGPAAVCQYGTYSYTVAATNGGTCFWYLPTGGQLSQNTGTSVSVTWTGNPQTNHVLTAVLTDSAGSVVEYTYLVGIIREQLTCNNAIQSSLDTGGQVLVTPDILLEGNYNTYAGYLVTVYTAAGVWPSNVLDCSLAGQSVLAEVSEPCSGNSCQTTLHIKDKMAPVILCPSDTVWLSCQESPEYVLPPMATDNCDMPPLMNLTNLEQFGTNFCAGITVRKRWVASDDAGNLSAPCFQYLFISPALAPMFPPDRTWDCGDIQNFPGALDPLPYTGDPATGGSGTPTGVTGTYCQAGYTHHDDTLGGCGNALTILRTWLVFNWCTGELIGSDPAGNDNLQYLYVKDNTGPQVSVPPVTVAANLSGWGNASGCRSTGFVPGPLVADNCSGIQLVRIFSSIGEIEYTNGTDGQGGGHIPAPGLPLGTHLIQYQVTDSCGNQTVADVTLTVLDEWQPVAVCDDFTTVSLDSDGFAWVFPATVDAGSYDNCCLANLALRREDAPGASFSDAVWVSCADDTILVTMRVLDCEGQSNECTVHILVRDQASPTCLPPPDKQLSCGDVPAALTSAWLSGFGTPLGTDNCSVLIEEQGWSVALDDCGAGSITRHFTAVDPSGNSSPPCSQTLQVWPDEDWMVVFPPDWTGDCFDPLSPDTLVISNFGCTLMAVSHFDQPAANPSDSACMTIIRTWQLSNWCLQGSNAPAIQIPHHPDGVFLTEADVPAAASITYTQYITVSDDQAPQLSPGFDSVLTIPADTCLLAGVSLPVHIEGECSTQLDIEYHLDLSADGTTDTSGTGQFVGDVPPGCHRILYRVRDGCHNLSELSVPFCVLDGKVPTAVCATGLVASLSDSGEVLVCADGLDGGSYDQCGGPLDFSFSTLPSDTCLLFTCEDVGAPYQVAVWVTDAAGNQSYCITEVTVQDNLGNCQLTGPLLGIITNEEAQPLEHVTVSLSGGGGSGNITTTDAAGQYFFPDLSAGQDYTISPYKNDDCWNGVTTMDILLIQQHILGDEPLGSPYQLIAADVNKSKTISTLDIVLIRKLLLFETDHFPGNTSWRFIRKDHVFQDPAHPWTGGFPEVYNINDFVPGWASADFIAVKVGDVNHSASTNLVGGPSTDEREGVRPLELVLADPVVQVGETFSLALSAKDFHGIRGMQFLLRYDTAWMECLGMEADNGNLLDRSCIGWASPIPGTIPVVWTEWYPVSLADGEPVVAFSFRARRSGRPARALAIDTLSMEALYYEGPGFVAGPVVLLAEDGKGEYPNHDSPIGNLWPNPFSEYFQLEVWSPAGGPVHVRIHDLSGRLVQESEVETHPGQNTLRFQVPAGQVGRMLRLEVVSGQERNYRWLFQAGG